MEKTSKLLLVSTLMLGCSGLVQAKSKVTLYGFLTTAYGHHQQKSTIQSDNPNFHNISIKKTQTGVSDGMKLGPRWGIKGTEDLGNGTEAIFTLESGFNLNNGETVMGSFFARQAFVGLRNDAYGSLTIGRQYNAASDFFAPLSTFGATLSSHSFRYAFGSAAWDRFNNMVKYTSPVWKGLQWNIGVYYERDDKPDENGYQQHGSSRGVTTAVRYSHGALKLAASFDISRQKGDIEGTPHGYNAPIPGTYISPDKNMSRKGWNLGMNYDFDVVKLHLLYGGQADGAFFDTGLLSYMPMPAEVDKLYRRSHDKGMLQHSWEAGVTVPVTSGMLKIAYMGSTLKNDRVGTKANGNMNQLSAAYYHFLSKRTSAYIGASYARAKVKNFDSDNTNVKTRQSEFFIGLSHFF